MLKKLLIFLILSLSAQALNARVLFIKIEGIDAEIAANVDAFLSIKALEDKPVDNSNRLRFLHRRADAEIRQALEPFGYYNPSINSELTQRTNNDWEATYRINPGERTRLINSQIQVSGPGQHEVFFQDIIDNAAIRKATYLNHQEYETLKAQLQTMAVEKGYYFGRFTQAQIQVDRDKNEANILIGFDTGERARVSEFRFVSETLDIDLLERYPDFEVGDFIDNQQLLALQSALIDSDYFTTVEVLPLLEEFHEDGVPVQITLTPKKRNLYTAGLGYGTDTGARLSAGLDRRYVNRRGHRLSLDVQLSEVTDTITGLYQIPGQQPRTDQMGLRGHYTHENSENVFTTQYTLGGFLRTQVGSWNRILSLDFENETFTFSRDKRTQFMLIPRMQFSKTRADQPLNPTQGYRMNFGLAGASHAVLSDVDMLQLSFSGKRVDTLNESIRLLSRVDLGALATSNFSRLPASLRFFTGGDSTIRGYDYRTIAPENAEGDIIGGRYMGVGSQELDYLFKPNWRVATFVDYGNVDNGFNSKVKLGYGVGIRWISPVGPIRLDIAKPFENKGVRLHFTMGPDL